jgi:lysophospholipase L1-like esterase
MVHRKGLYVAGAVVLSTGFFLWGIVVHRNHVFPYEQIRLLNSLLNKPPPPVNAPPADAIDPYWLVKASFFKEFSRRSEIVMIGDSITERAEWSEMFPSVTIANRGISGDTTRGLLNRMEGIFAVNATKAFLMAGINDLFANRTVPEIVDNYSQIIKLLLERGVKVYVQSTLLCNVHKTESCDAKMPLIHQLNHELSKISAPNLMYIDLNAALSDRTGLKDEFTDDGIHLNTKGYSAWRRQIAPYILSPRS